MLLPLVSSPAGVTDHFAQDEPHALAITRNIFANLNLRNMHSSSSSSSKPSSSSSSSSSSPVYDPNWEEPLYDPSELRGAVPSDSKAPWDVRGVLGRILDGSRFEEFKSNYGKTLVTGASPRVDLRTVHLFCVLWQAGVRRK
jgi:3-methylcrotonyl-CoA carboxylase beta subunit